jgi:hypothetical protein
VSRDVAARISRMPSTMRLIIRFRRGLAWLALERPCLLRREIRPTMTFTDLADESATEMPLPRAVTANRYRTDDRPTG